MPVNRVISVVDDDSSVREGMLDLLGSMGFIAVAFERAEEFLQPLRHALPDRRRAAPRDDRA
jgi:FixJ family two-component response regulator